MEREREMEKRKERADEGVERKKVTERVDCLTGGHAQLSSNRP